MYREWGGLEDQLLLSDRGEGDGVSDFSETVERARPSSTRHIHVQVCSCTHRKTQTHM